MLHSTQIIMGRERMTPPTPEHITAAAAELIGQAADAAVDKCSDYYGHGVNDVLSMIIYDAISENGTNPHFEAIARAAIIQTHDPTQAHITIEDLFSNSTTAKSQG